MSAENEPISSDATEDDVASPGCSATVGPRSGQFKPIEEMAAIRRLRVASPTRCPDIGDI
jgi:hypothetical protein